jgi:hypothetical protein
LAPARSFALWKKGAQHGGAGRSETVGLGGAAALQLGPPATGVICGLLTNLRTPPAFDHIALLSGLLVALALYIRSVPSLRIFFLLSGVVVRH